jgi:hypothetical protein
MSNIPEKLLTLRDSRRVVKLMLLDALEMVGRTEITVLGFTFNIPDRLNPEIDSQGEYQTAQLLEKWWERIDAYRSKRPQVEDRTDH